MKPLEKVYPAYNVVVEARKVAELMACKLCGTPGKRRNRITKHHYYHPKKSKWARRKPLIIIELCQRCHRSYHIFYDTHCRHGCQYDCSFKSVCCYRYY
jgi:hypothetical protein